MEAIAVEITQTGAQGGAPAGREAHQTFRTRTSRHRPLTDKDLAD